MIDLKGHSVVVTGSTKGVGRSIVEACAKAGADVIIHGRAVGAESETVLKNCRAHGVKASFVTADLTGPVEQTTQKFLADCLAIHPRLDILINNAGQYFDVPYEEMTLQRFERTMRLNVTTPFFLTQVFAKHWIEQKINGRVLFIGSINGRLAEPVSTAYDVSKGGIEMMVKTLAVALAPKNIRVNGLAPGLVRTPQTSWVDKNPTDAKWMAHHTPNGQVPSSDVCGPGAVYLVSDDAEHVHGHMLLVDGGMSIWQQPGRGPYA